MPTGLQTIAFLALLLALSPVSQAPCGQETAKEEKSSLQRISQEASDPVGELWLLTNQFNLNLQRAPNNLNFQESRPQFNYNFQPVLKFDLNDHWRLLTRPVIPLYDSPEAMGRSGVERTSGLGDIELKGVLSPRYKSPYGFKWGIGPSAVFPSATDTRLGDGKWQLGGAMTALYLDDTWVVGMFPEHWWSVGGAPSRPAVSRTKAQYFIWYSPIPTWQVGMSPTVTIDWLRKSEDAVTLPVGLGLAKTVLLGKLPVKFGIEVDYAVVGPRRVPGDEWTFRFTFMPIIPELF